MDFTEYNVQHYEERIRMKKNINIVLVLLALFACVTMALAEMKEGLWEIKATMEMPGMPMKIPATTTQTCITKNDMVPKPSAQKGKDQDCKIKEQKITGDTVTYSMECTEKGSMTMEITGETTYKGDTMQGTSKMTVKGPTPMEMSTKVSGKYIGPCTK
jgi:hypothetical protein